MRWYERDPVRLELEKRLLKQFYPNVTLTRQHGQLSIHMKVRGRKNTYRGELIYPNDFPFSAISAYIRSPKIGSSPHRYSSERLCLCEPADVGLRTTGKVFCDWFEQWIYNYERWLDGTPWPVRSGG